MTDAQNELRRMLAEAIDDAYTSPDDEFEYDPYIAADAALEVFGASLHSAWQNAQDWHQVAGAREADLDQALWLLYKLRFDMHQVYGNTSRRGRGIGGQAMTPQCSVIDPEGDELELLDKIDRLLGESREALSRAVAKNAE